MSDANQISFELQGEGNFIKIQLLKLSSPDAHEDWDRNWINSRVTLKAGGFSGIVSCALMTTDFMNFKQDLLKLINQLEGTALFKTIEGQVEIAISGDGVGHFQATCEVTDDIGDGNTLNFHINFDQTFLPDLLNQLDIITQAYPSTIKK